MRSARQNVTRVRAIDQARTRHRLAMTALAMFVLIVASATLIGRVEAQTPAQASASLPPVTASDRILGNADAPITVIEYASFVCPTCATWNISTLPLFQAKYIDTGQVRLIMRDMLTEPAQQAAIAASIARCAVPDRYYDVAHTLFVWQSTARNFQDWSAWYSRAATQTGIPVPELLTCVQSPETAAAVQASVAAGAAAGVQGTPTFFVNGRIVPGNGAMQDLSIAIDPLIRQ